MESPSSVRWRTACTGRPIVDRTCSVEFRAVRFTCAGAGRVAGFRSRRNGFCWHRDWHLHQQERRAFLAGRCSSRMRPRRLCAWLVSPGFAEDGILWAGTDSAGLWLSGGSGQDMAAVGRGGAAGISERSDRLGAHFERPATPGAGDGGVAPLRMMAAAPGRRWLPSCWRNWRRRQSSRRRASRARSWSGLADGRVLRLKE